MQATGALDCASLRAAAAEPPLAAPPYCDAYVASGEDLSLASVCGGAAREETAAPCPLLMALTLSGMAATGRTK